MKAATYTRYGAPEVVSIADVPRPEPKTGEVLVQVFATSVTTADWRLRAAAFPGILWLPGRLMFGLLAPRTPILGSDFAGRVVSLGPGVTRFKLGDPVFGFVGAGAHAEYVSVPEDGAITVKPAGLDYDEAAAVPFGALAALVFLRDFAGLTAGQKVLVVGASGGVGAFAVQLAKHFGAEVTGVASTPHIDLVRDLGADHVIDYSQQDFTRGDRRYDVILDTVGVTRFGRVRRVLTSRGRFVPLNFGLRELVAALLAPLRGGQRVVINVSGDKREDLELVANLLQSGKLRPVIDRRFALDEIVEAHRRTEGRHKTGSVVVTVSGPGGTEAKP